MYAEYTQPQLPFLCISTLIVHLKHMISISNVGTFELKEEKMEINAWLRDSQHKTSEPAI